jgi:DNA (cytosine-5)-methyltransferase 1
MEMTFIDFFSGIGGFRKGFELCGMQCVGHCEINQYANRSYRAIFDIKEDEWYANDITKIRSGDLPRANLWAGGFPCQDVSCSGRQQGLDGARSGLFFEIIRLLQGTAPENRPEWIVLENVKNLLSVNKGFDLATVLYSLAVLGYCVEYGLLNSKFFGVPQNRERIYIVAYRHLGAGRERKIFPVTAGSGKALIQLIGGMQGQRVYDPCGVSVTISSESGGWGGKTGLYFIDLNKNTKLTDTSRCIKERYNCGVTNRSADNSGIFYGCRAALTPDRPKKRQNGRRFKECGEPSFTLTEQDKHGVFLCNCESCANVMKIKNATKQGYMEAKCGDSIVLSFPGSTTGRGRVVRQSAHTLDTSCNQGIPLCGCGRIRRLTPRECWRLQGFSDEMFNKARAVNSDNQLYRQAGNSVTIPVVYAIGQRIVEIQSQIYREWGGTA